MPVGETEQVIPLCCYNRAISIVKSFAISVFVGKPYNVNTIAVPTNQFPVLPSVYYLNEYDIGFLILAKLCVIFQFHCIRRRFVGCRLYLNLCVIFRGLLFVTNVIRVDECLPSRYIICSYLSLTHSNNRRHYKGINTKPSMIHNYYLTVFVL